MVCELHNCCQFFKDNMAGLPNAEEYVKRKLCFGDYQRCNRYRIYFNSEGDSTGNRLHSSDEEEVRKITRCLNKKQERPPE